MSSMRLENRFLKTNERFVAGTRQRRESLTVRYNYYAAQPDAGACWVDEEFFYINPVHCCLYVPGRLHESCSLSSGFRKITGMPPA